MSEHLATTKTDRRKQIRILRERNARFQAEGDRKIHSQDPSISDQGYAAHDEAYAGRWALGFVARHVNLETGELTIPLSEPEDAAP